MKFGEIIALAVRDATAEALRWQNGLESSYTRGVFHALGRYGVKEATVFDERRTPRLQDGPAWWAAREAIEHMAGARRERLRTWLVAPDAAVVNAHLLCRDALVDRLNERGWRMLRAALLGRSQQRIAEEERITKSAVSQQFARGISALRDAQALLEQEAVGGG